MEQASELAISGAVGTALRLITAAGLNPQFIPYVAMLAVTVIMLLYGISTEAAFTRQLIWPYFLTWLNMNGVAAGAYHITGTAINKSQE